MSQPFSFTGAAFSTLDTTSGIMNLPPFVNKPDACKLTVADNVRLIKGGGIRMPRAGFEVKADLGTSAKVDDITTLPTLGGIMFCKSGTSIFQSVDGVTWYTVGLTRTATAREFLFPNEQDVFATNGTDAYTRIACSKVTTTFAHTDVEITVDDIGQFAASGTIYINGDAIAYTGITASKLTGVTGIATGGHAAASVVTQTSSPAGAPLATCIAELEGSAVAALGARVYVSNPSTVDEPELFWDFSVITNGTAKRLSSDVTCLMTGLGAVLIGKKDGMDISLGYDFESGKLLTKSITKTHPVPNARCMTEGEREFYVLTDSGRILPVMNLDTGFQVVEDQSKPMNNFDYPVQSYIQENKDPDNSKNFIHYDPASRELTACILMNTGNTVEFVHQRNIGAWSIDRAKNYGCKTNFKGRVYGGDASDDKIYLDAEGTTDNLQPIVSRIVTGKFKLGRKGVTGDYLLLSYGGVMSPNGVFSQRIYRNGALVGNEEILATNLQNEGLMTVTSGVPAGAGVVSAETIGGAGSTPEVFPFEVPYEMMFDAEDVQIEWEVTDESTSLELRYFDLSGEADGELLIPHT